MTSNPFLTQLIFPSGQGQAGNIKTGINVGAGGQAGLSAANPAAQALFAELLGGFIADGNKTQTQLSQPLVHDKRHDPVAKTPNSDALFLLQNILQSGNTVDVNAELNTDFHLTTGSAGAGDLDTLGLFTPKLNDGAGTGIGETANSPLFNLLSSVVKSSRDASELQIGQHGKTVEPKLILVNATPQTMAKTAQTLQVTFGKIGQSGFQADFAKLTEELKALENEDITLIPGLSQLLITTPAQSATFEAQAQIAIQNSKQNQGQGQDQGQNQDPIQNKNQNSLKMPAGANGTAASENAASGQDDLAARLNALTVGETAEDGLSPSLTGEITGMQDAADPSGESRFARFITALKQAAGTGGQNGQITDGAAAKMKAAGAGDSSAVQPNSGLPALGQPDNGLWPPEGWEWGDSAEWLPGRDVPNFNAPRGFTLLSSIVAQSPQAGQAHPATQTVAANIQKHANSSNGNQTFEIQLDPPDLGRVNVRLDFNQKDKSVKAHLTIEKPETWLMLQRDAHVLEKALHDAGLDTSDSSVSFELAQHDGNDFDGQRQGRNSYGGDGGQRGETGTENAMEIIETEMTWYMDPDTGHQRYNLLV